MTGLVGLTLAMVSLMGASLGSELTEEQRAECVMWSHLENKTMPLQDQGHATCRTNDECSGFTCEGHFKGSPVMFGMRVLHCQEPPGLELFGHAPQFNAKNFSHVFKHGSRYEIPGVFLNGAELPSLNGESLPKLPMMPSDVPGLNLYFLVSMEPMPGGKTLNCGLEIQACVNTSVVDNEMVKRLHGDEMCVINKPIFNDTEIPIPMCEETYPAKVLVGEMCNFNEINQCGDHMTCVQDSDESETGKCECLSSFRQKADRTCEEDAPLPQPRVASGSEAGTGAGAVIAAVLCILALVVISILGVTFVRRFRLLPRLKARLTNTPYEDIVISDTKKATIRQSSQTTPA